MPERAPSTVALLSPRWGASDEVCWAMRQVAGALACSTEVQVITPQGSEPRTYEDGVFIVHELASSDRAADRRRDLALAALSSAAQNGSQSSRGQSIALADEPGVRDLILGDRDPWAPATSVLERLGATSVVVADYRSVGAIAALERSDTDAPVTLLPLAMDLASTKLPIFAPVFERAARALVFSDSERSATSSMMDPARVHFVGLPLATNPSISGEPEPHAGGERDYLLLVLGKALWPPGTSPWIDLLRARFPDRKLVVSASDLLVVYEKGKKPNESQGMEKASDLLRLMAWAHLTIDLRPGSLVALRSLQSLLYGTPIVVPQRSRAREHADVGSAGLWFSGPGELLWDVDAILDIEVRNALGRQGARYAAERYGSTDSFIDKVGVALSPA